MRNKHSLLFGLAVLLLILVIGLPFMLKGFKGTAGQGAVYAHVQSDAIMSPRQSITLQFSSPMVPVAVWPPGAVTVNLAPVAPSLAAVTATL